MKQNRIILVVFTLLFLALSFSGDSYAAKGWVNLDEGVKVMGGEIPASIKVECGTTLSMDDEQCTIPKADDLCISLTAYWPFDDDGNAIPFNGQADATPNQTANGFHISPANKNTVAAAPLGLVGGNVSVFGIDAVIQDTFGHDVYQHGVFWHDYYERWVLPIDILSDDEIHYLVCDDFLVTTEELMFDGQLLHVKSQTVGKKHRLTGLKHRAVCVPDINERMYNINKE